MYKTQLDQPIAASTSAIVPAHEMNKLTKHLEDKTGLLSIRFLQEQGIAVFQLSDFQFISKLIEGDFPDIKNLVSGLYRSRAICNTTSLLNACRQAELSISDGISVVKLKLNASNNKTSPLHLEFTADEQEPYYVDFIDADVEGVDQEIGLNPRFLREALGAFDSPKVVIDATEPHEPVVFRPVGGDDYLHVIMPMQLN